MREILFKAKRKDNGKWAEGSLMRYKDGNSFICCEDYIPDVMNKYDVIDSSVCQYTGLTDSNGEKVFEGDILEFEDKASKIEWKGVVLFGNPNKEYTWGWQIKRVSGDDANTDILLWFDMEECRVYSKVVGNIYEERENERDTF